MLAMLLGLGCGSLRTNSVPIYLTQRASVSEVHVRIYRDAGGDFCLENCGRYGTTVDGADVPNGHVAKLGLKATIGIRRCR
jgi:hypothetical protein